MKKILQKIFGKRPAWQVINFTQQITASPEISILLAESGYVNYLLLSRLQSWSSCYRKLKIFVPTAQLKFWQAVSLPENFSLHPAAEIAEVENEFIINFSDASEILDILDQKKSCAISDIDNRYNLLFQPLLASEYELLLKLENFFEAVEFSTKKLERKPVQVEPVKAFILDIGHEVANRKCLTLIDNLKRDFQHEIYLIGPEFDTAEFVSLQKYPMQTLAEKFSIAAAGLVFFSDNEDTAKLFACFDLDLIYIGKQQLENVRNIDPLANFEMKNSISEIIKRG
ncbi:MAG: hypothetical protein R6U84_06725 [Candidatus Cloacimonadales bacterium]